MTEQKSLTATISEESVPKLKSEFLFQMRIKLAPPINIGPNPNGNRGIYMAESGTIKGPRIKGDVLPMSGGDWSIIRADGSGVLDVRLTLKTDDGVLILITYNGRMLSSAENFEYAIDFSKPDDPKGATRYYFRINPLFETGDERYTWLNHIVAIGNGRTGDAGVIYDIFEIK